MRLLSRDGLAAVAVLLCVCTAVGVVGVEQTSRKRTDSRRAKQDKRHETYDYGYLLVDSPSRMSLSRRSQVLHSRSVARPAGRPSGPVREGKAGSRLESYRVMSQSERNTTDRRKPEEVTMENVHEKAPRLSRLLLAPENRPLLLSANKPVNLFYPELIIRTDDEKQRIFVGPGLQDQLAGLDSIRVQLMLGYEPVKVNLRRNKFVVSPAYRQKSFISYEKDEITKNVETSCFYTGYVRGFQNTSRVSMSACGHGLRAVIHWNDRTYLLRPLNGVVELPDDKSDQIKGTSFRVNHMAYGVYTKNELEYRCGNLAAHFTTHTDAALPASAPGIHLDASSNEGESNTELFTQRIDIALILDNSLYKGLNRSVDKLIFHAKELINSADAFMPGTSFRLSLSYLEVWDDIPRLEVLPVARATLRNVLLYRNSSLRRVRHQALVLLTSLAFEASTFGLAVHDSMCTDRAVAVISENLRESPTQAAVRLVHVIGHMLGVNDDTRSCHCSDPASGCIMEPYKFNRQWFNSTPSQLSDCSMSGFSQARSTSCLHSNLNFNDDKYMFTLNGPVCGNGVKERGEECDCGDACNNTCCDPRTCLLLPWATCDSGVCCLNCVARAAGHVCRQKSGECDVTEYCDGVHSECPPDTLVQTGWPCSNDGICYRGRCRSHSQQCIEAWGPEAGKSSDSCYERNSQGTEHEGHCGKHGTSYVPCDKRDIQCGVLQCQGGPQSPVSALFTKYLNTGVKINQTRYTCKIISEMFGGKALMVPDGSQCAEGAICVSQRCVPLISSHSARCPVDHNGKPCSRRGVCSTVGLCVCSPGYNGTFCQYELPTTSSPVDLPGHLQPTQPAEQGTQNKRLVIVGAVIAVCIIVLAVVIFVIYRHRCPRQSKPGQMTSLAGKEDGLDDTERVISFGHMPSYSTTQCAGFCAREDKKRRRHRRKRFSSQEEDLSPDRPEMITIVHDTNSKQPEKGILKNRDEAPRTHERSVFLPLSRCQHCQRLIEREVADEESDAGSFYGSVESLSMLGSEIESCRCHSDHQSIISDQSASAGDALSQISDADDETFSDTGSQGCTACDRQTDSSPQQLQTHTRAVEKRAGASGLTSSLENIPTSHISSLDKLSQLSDLDLHDIQHDCTEDRSSASAEQTNRQAVRHTDINAPHTNNTSDAAVVELEHIDTLMALLQHDDHTEPDYSARGGESDSWQGGVARPMSVTSEEVRSSEPEAERSFRRYHLPPPPSASSATQPKPLLTSHGRHGRAGHVPPGDVTRETVFRPLHAADKHYVDQQKPVFKPQAYSPLKKQYC